MFLADGDNNSIWTVAMKEWDVVDTFKVSSDAAANTVLHKIVTDKAGNLLVARTTAGVFRFNFDGVA